MPIHLTREQIAERIAAIPRDPNRLTRQLSAADPRDGDYQSSQET